jgi:hexosaminidase
MPLEFIKKYIDNMAMHKLNTFHWHLTEDQGWRIEIKKYPKLTEVGAWRKETLIGHVKDKPHKFDGKRHGGFYTQEQAKEIVQYAKDRFITVVPEIEMPGHAKAAIAAYPELGVTGKPVEVATYWGIFPDIFNVEESTFKFLEDVLTEVMDIFPSEYIHIGGDEAIKDQWKASDKIQQKIKELGLEDEHQLQSYFIKRMEKFINSRGRKLIGWDEILEGGLAPNATVMSWQGVEGGIAAARSNHDVIMTPAQYLYFWTYQADPATEPFAFGGYIPLQKVYSFEPIPAELTADQSKYILGAQGCAWTEYMETPRDVEYMVFPRMSALSEIVWSPKGSKDWKDFTTRMTKQYKRYDQRKINYAKVPFDIPMELK